VAGCAASVLRRRNGVGLPFFQKKIPLALGLAVGATLAFGQQKPLATSTQDTTSKLKIETAETVEGFLRNDREQRKLSGNVRLRQENTLIYCDTAFLDGDDALLRGSVVIEQGDSVQIFADSALYFAKTRQSDLFGRVVLANGTQKLFTRKMHYDVGEKVATYRNGARMTNGQSQLTSRYGTYLVNEKVIYFKGDVLITNPEFTVRTDTMNFLTENQVAEFVAPTLISQQGSKIYTEGGFYDIENNFAEFDKNPQYERDQQRGRARTMRYLGTTKEYILQDSAYIEEPKRFVQADVIRYQTESEKATLIGNAYYRDSTQEITGEQIRYDSRNKNYQLLGRGRVSDPPNIIEADSLDFNDALGNGFAQGAVEWRDTSSDMVVRAFRLDYNKKTDYLYAYGGFDDGPEGRPMMTTLIDRDTLYLAADTLTSFKPDSTSDVRKLLAYRDVRIFKSDMQAVSDSLAFSSADSIFWFYKIVNFPVIWSDTSQFSGDTIKMLLKNKQLDRIWLRENALVVNSEDGLLFNQIKGKYTTAYFRDNEVREMLVDKNAQAVYYALDDNRAYIGVNETECAEMRLYFGDNKVNSIKFYDAPTGSFTPIKKVGKSPKLLDGFFWDSKRRPRRVRDIL
jgi:lipopolysaccharide export system protein LptA